MKGVLVYLPERDRMAILCEGEQNPEELHCGDSLCVWNHEHARWEETRIEYSISNDWYLVGKNAKGISSLQGRKVKT